MTYTVTFTVQRGGQTRAGKTNIAGCQDEADARRKMRELYHFDVLTIRKIEPAGLSQDLVGRKAP